MIALEEVSVTSTFPWCGDLRSFCSLIGVRVFRLACRERAGELVYDPETGRVGTWWGRDLRWWPSSTPEAAVVELSKGCGCT